MSNLVHLDAVCVALVGCVSFPPFFLTRCPQSAALQVSSCSYSFHTTPFTSNPGILPWLPRWGDTRDPSVSCPGHYEGLASLLSLALEVLCIFLGEFQIFLRYDLCGHPLLYIGLIIIATV